jgi:hypothetical protein
VELPVGKFGRMLAILPSLLTLSLDKKLRPTCRFLVHHVGIPQEKLTSIISFFPQVKSAMHSLVIQSPLIACFMHRNVFSREMHSRAGADPQVLCISIEKKLNPTINYLINVVGVPREKVAGVLCKKPQLFGYLSEKIQRTISFLRNEVCSWRSVVRFFQPVLPRILSHFCGSTGRCVGARHT